MNNKELTNEEKILLVDKFSGMRAYSLIPLFVIFGVCNSDEFDCF